VRSEVCQICNESFSSWHGRVHCFEHRNVETESELRKRMRRFTVRVIAWDAFSMATMVEGEDNDPH
jgi:hypothetical protein